MIIQKNLDYICLNLIFVYLYKFLVFYNIILSAFII